MQDKDTIKSTFDQLFESIFSNTFTQKITELGVDKYVKKLTAIQLTQLIAYAQIQRQSNLRDIANNLRGAPHRSG